METVRRILGWMPGSVEQAVIRVTEEGVHVEGVVLGGSLEEPFAIRYAVMTDAEGRCRGVTTRAMGSPDVLEFYGDGRGGWTDAVGTVIREFDGAIDVDIGITPVMSMLAARRLALAVGASASFTVACLDTRAATIRAAEHRYGRLSEDQYHIEQSETGASERCQLDVEEWTFERLAGR